MSATVDGDKPKRKRAPRAIPKMSVERDIAVAEEIGTIKGALKHHEDRMDRSDAATQLRLSSLETEIRSHAANSAKEFEKLGDGQQAILLAMNGAAARKGVWAFLFARLEFVIGVCGGLAAAWITRK